MNSIENTILFVDDEKGMLEIFSEYFPQKGYRVVTAKNGLEAVKILEKERIDCCFTDISMPEMDGLELAEHIRKKDNTIPVVIVTAYPSIENTIKTLKNGVVDFLIKPVDLNQMDICIKRILRERKLFTENILLKKEMENKLQIEKLNNELLYKVEELQIINKIMSNFTTVKSSSDLFARVVDIVIEITSADESMFYIINEQINKPIRAVSSFAGKKANDPNEIDKLKTIDNGSTGLYSKNDKGAEKALEQLIMEVASDEVPLIISENKGARGLPLNMLSFVAVPLSIRKKVFGVLTASIKKGEFRFTERDLYYLSFMTRNTASAIENLVLYENIYENLFSTLYAFVKALEVRDPYTQQHSNRVTRWSLIIGREMGCTEEELDIINFAGHLHDIGKIGIRDDILLKPGKLTDEEFENIKQHPAIGEKIVEHLGLWDKEKQIIRSHHERFDGTGYPDGLKKEEIYFLARILSVADAYDAMASDRAYRKKMEADKILRIIGEGSGTQFDPDVVSVFQKLYKEGKILQESQVASD